MMENIDKMARIKREAALVVSRSWLRSSSRCSR